MHGEMIALFYEENAENQNEPNWFSPSFYFKRAIICPWH